jgi:hypothetical protein
LANKIESERLGTEEAAMRMRKHTRRSAWVMPGPPFRGILSPPDTSII